MLNPRVLVPVSDGSEEIETVVIADVLRRAGVDVVLARVPAAGVADAVITASRGVRLVTDRPLSACLDADWNAVVLPGGLPGAEHLRDSAELTNLLRRHDGAGRILAAICAAPAVVLAHHGLLRGRRATCHPSLRHELPVGSRNDAPVVVDGSLVTSQGPGTAVAFAVALVGQLCGADKKDEIAAQLLLSR